jgi:IclR family acetate operon transcriptional repressor
VPSNGTPLHILRAVAAQPKTRSGGINAPRSVVIALRTLEALSQLQPIGVGELSQKIELPKSTVQRTLIALEAAGFAYRSGKPTTWSLTLKVFQIGSRAMRGFDVITVSEPYLAQLRDSTRESVSLVLLDGYQTVIAEHVASPEPVRAHAEIGAAFPMNCTSAGKAFLADADEDFVDEFLSEPLETLTPRSITDPEKLRAEIQKTARRGYAINSGESRPEVVSVAAAIRDGSNRAIACLVVVGPSARLNASRTRALGEQVRVTADEISAKLGWRPGGR